MQSWCSTWPPNGSSRFRVKQKLHKKPRRACKSAWSPIGILKSFTLTIPWNSAKLVKISPGIIARLHHTDQKHIGLLKERCAEWKKAPLPCCCNQVWMKVGRKIPWNAKPICEMFKISDLMGRPHIERRFGQPFKGPIILFGSLVEYHLFTAKDQSRIRQFGKKVLPGLFLGYALYVEGIWKGDVLIADIEELETMDASGIYSKRLNAKEVIFPRQGNLIFRAEDGRIKLLGRYQELRTSTLVRHRPIQGEGHVDFLGESEGSLPQPYDSLPDAGEAINDFWSISGNFIYRHHVEPRVKLYSPWEESFPIPLSYLDVSRITCTNLDVKQEKRIDDYWNVDGSRDLFDSWTGFTQFTPLEENSQTDKCVPVGDWRENSWHPCQIIYGQSSGTKLGRNAQLKEKQKWSHEKPKLDHARKIRGIYFIDLEFKESIKNARQKLETAMAPAMPCKTSKNSQHGATIGKSNEIKSKLACI